MINTTYIYKTTKAYVPRSPWILTGNVRENIIFGNPYDSLKYDRTVKACALTKDFELFSAGDLTEMGERGINMSGGQKQRIQLVRAVSQDADIYLLDDPFSAVDAHTGTKLFEASTDQSVVDLEMANKLGWCAFTVIQILGTVAVMSQVAWEVFVIFIPVTAICIWYQQYYIPTARELAHLAGIQRAPILHHFAESLAGAATIRAFDQKGCFFAANLCLIDNHSRPWFHNVSAMEWLSFRLNQLSNFVFAFSLVLLVTLPEGIINPSIAGLAVTYGISLNIQQAAVIWNICNAENKMISVERILQYSNIASEAPLVIEDCRPPNNWPEIGTICFRNLQASPHSTVLNIFKKIRYFKIYFHYATNHL
ncbi:hypothetical protein F0562_014637 [Nyssa sinensis]|uniref:ABC transmembrane type-1 domain-containing protein n=1 Tax=Nyssa sinensis TaxID=561372 RepID=A0A5J4ZTF9_9ASTE|nr:hypothetical protein F0562_014637 [Nyssa sinensis]